MLSEKNKQTASELQVWQKKKKTNREILLGKYLNKTEDPTHSYVSTYIVEQAPEWFFRDWVDIRILKGFYWIKPLVYELVAKNVKHWEPLKQIQKTVTCLTFGPMDVLFHPAHIWRAVSFFT